MERLQNDLSKRAREVWQRLDDALSDARTVSLEQSDLFRLAGKTEAAVNREEVLRGSAFEGKGLGHYMAKNWSE